MDDFFSLVALTSVVEEAAVPSSSLLPLLPSVLFEPLSVDAADEHEGCKGYECLQGIIPPLPSPSPSLINLNENVILAKPRRRKDLPL